MQNKRNLQWVSPAEAVKQSLDGMLRYSFLTKNLCSTSSAVCYIKSLCIYDCCSTCVGSIYVIWSLLLLLYQAVDREEWHVFGLCIATSMLDCASCINVSCLHAEKQTMGTFQLLTIRFQRRRCFCDGSMINAEQLLHSSQQHEVDAALSPLLGLQQPASTQEAFPPAACDMHELVQQLDLRIAPDGEHSKAYTFLVCRLALTAGLSFCASA